MNHLKVNGKPIDYAAAPEQSMPELMERIRHDFNSDAAVISSIRIDGTEVDEDIEAAIGALKVSDIGSIEIFTAHPRELAEETLQSLLEFTSHLELLSRNAGAKLVAGLAPKHEFMRLIDGIQTFSDALLQSRQILHVGRLEAVAILEADLASLLKDLVQFTESGDRDYVIDLLQNHLPLNLADWRGTGIPTLIRSRDS
jgi:hypothetical protein